MTTETILALLLLGWLIGLTLKYFIVGLYHWDVILHPERVHADLTGPYHMFAFPFLGVFHAPCNC